MDHVIQQQRHRPIKVFCFVDTWHVATDQLFEVGMDEQLDTV